MKKPPLVLFLVGPTGIGKSKIAMELAHRLKGEIISADSMQVYQGMNIGTAKPTQVEQKQVRHHLIDIVKPSQSFSAHRYRQLALKSIQDVLTRHRFPMVVGGSGLYIRALLEGLSSQPGTDRSFRKELEKKIKSQGLKPLYQRLKRIDPQAAKAIKPTDAKRIIRALEMIHQSGKGPTAWYQKSPAFESLGYRPFVIGLTQDRSHLYDRINSRVDLMFEEGWVREVKRLTRGRMSKTAAQAVGYKEIREALKKSRGHQQAKELIEQSTPVIKRNTRRLAKRQMTWFRKERGIQWIHWDIDESAHSICDKIMKGISQIEESD